jgi:hypothetical protein
MQKFGGQKNPLYLRENNHDPRSSKSYRGTKSHARFEAKKSINKELPNEQ